MIPLYSQQKNDPFVDKERKTMKTRGIIENNNYRDEREKGFQKFEREQARDKYGVNVVDKGNNPNALVDMSLTVNSPKPPKKKDPSLYFPVTTAGPNVPPQFFPGLAQPLLHNFMKPTIVKNILKRNPHKMFPIRTYPPAIFFSQGVAPVLGNQKHLCNEFLIHFREFS